jgi:hypothetical protein
MYYQKVEETMQSFLYYQSLMFYDEVKVKYRGGEDYDWIDCT